jgi:transcriptional regulator with XRE-family HTH domain
MMDSRTEIREFLASRRAKISPAKAGLTPTGTVRRVPGLRREEVAQLAGLSVDYYTRLERGRAEGVSESVLDAIARTLQLDDSERGYLFELAKPSSARSRSGRPLPVQRVRQGIYQLIDAMETIPAVVQGRNMNILATNRMGRTLYADFDSRPVRERNWARFVYFDPAAASLFRDWEQPANDCVAMLRLYAGRFPGDKQLAQLIGELSMHSDYFRQKWVDYNVRSHNTGTKRFHHPLVGDLDLQYEAMPVPGDNDQLLVTYTAEPASPSAERLALLASWTATPAPQTEDHGNSQNRPERQ